jgi:adenosylcobinamide-phosphate synthase
MSNIFIALAAFCIDRIFGEFKIKHPVEYMGDFILWFEKKYYKDSICRGVILTISLILISGITAFCLDFLASYLGIFWHFILISILSSMFIASNMLYNSVKDVLYSQNQKEALSMLVSRDTKDMRDSDINKALIETYSENLSDGVIAPIFYLAIFGFYGIVIYKAINTLDSMVGYRTAKYEKFGKFSAIIDDIVNYIPSKITTILIAIAALSKNAFFCAFKYGYKHDSPNAGYPISAMAGAVGVQLGGPTSYHGKIKDKPFFGNGRLRITANDVLNALSLQVRLDALIILLLGVALVCKYYI